VVGQQNADIADAVQLRDVAMATISGFLWGAYWRNLANTTEPSMWGGDAASCQITSTTSYYYRPQGRLEKLSGARRYRFQHKHAWQ